MVDMLMVFNVHIGWLNSPDVLRGLRDSSAKNENLWVVIFWSKIRENTPQTELKIMVELGNQRFPERNWPHRKFSAISRINSSCSRKQDQRSTAPTLVSVVQFSQLVSASYFKSVIISFSVSVFQFGSVKFSQLKLLSFTQIANFVPPCYIIKIGHFVLSRIIIFYCCFINYNVLEAH